jgi:hypothetical protein
VIAGTGIKSFSKTFYSLTAKTFDPFKIWFYFDAPLSAPNLFEPIVDLGGITEPLGKTEPL